MLKDGERPLETGEQTFFQGLYQDHYRALFSYAYHLGVGREAAEDYVQEAFLTALRQAIREDRFGDFARKMLEQGIYA